ncbi:hypothetical protein D3C81_2166080 [compost metagenome]
MCHTFTQGPREGYCEGVCAGTLELDLQSRRTGAYQVLHRVRGEEKYREMSRHQRHQA